jgi:hypothetical protein
MEVAVGSTYQCPSITDLPGVNLMSQSPAEPASQPHSYLPHKVAVVLLVFLIVLRIVLRSNAWSWFGAADAPPPAPPSVPPEARIAADTFLQRLKENQLDLAKQEGTLRLQQAWHNKPYSLIVAALENPAEELSFVGEGMTKVEREFQVVCEYELQENRLMFSTVAITLKDEKGVWRVDQVAYQGGLSYTP